MYHRLIVISLSVLSLFGLISTFTSDELRVTLTNGSKLVGRYLRSYSGRPIKAFTAIPYAKPPIGHLRFQNPEPSGRWDGEYQAIYDGPMCSQRNPFIRSFKDVGSEDCLYLNVYAPHMVNEFIYAKKSANQNYSQFKERNSNLPVMMYIHGGGFVCGSGSRSTYAPDYILDQDVILVTTNYRVGPLGFLSTEDENCPGNFGLKDQVMALNWVRQNIKQFGGDPESVTIFGSAAGGASVTYLMASPLAEGLFAKAIAHSGTNLAPWSQPAHKGIARKQAKQLAEKFNCYIPNEWSLSIDCLREIPAINITAATYDFFEFDIDPMVAFAPVVEPELPGAFITKHPRDGVTENSLKIPFLAGITFDEGLLRSAHYFSNPDLLDEFINNIDHALPIIFYYDHHNLSVQETISNKIKEFYFNSNLWPVEQKNVTNLFSDGWFLTAMDAYLRMRLAQKEAASTYVFLLTPKESISFSSVFRGDPDIFYGVSHADGTLYLFPVRERLFPTTLPTKDEEQIQKAMIQISVDFARTGNPTPHSSSLPKWDKVKGFPVNYYRIGNLNFEEKTVFEMEDGGIFEDRAKFWCGIGPNFPTEQLKNDEREHALTGSSSRVTPY